MSLPPTAYCGRRTRRGGASGVRLLMSTSEGRREHRWGNCLLGGYMYTVTGLVASQQLLCRCHDRSACGACGAKKGTKLFPAEAASAGLGSTCQLWLHCRFGSSPRVLSPSRQMFTCRLLREINAKAKPSQSIYFCQYTVRVTPKKRPAFFCVIFTLSSSQTISKISTKTNFLRSLSLVETLSREPGLHFEKRGRICRERVGGCTVAARKTWAREHLLTSSLMLG